jgi:virginiamycin B lyase
MLKRIPSSTRTTSSLLALSAAFLAMAGVPAAADAAVGEVTKVPLRTTDTDPNGTITAGADGNLWVGDAGVTADEGDIARPGKLWRVSPGNGSATGFPIAAPVEQGGSLGPISANESGVWHLDANGGMTKMSYGGALSSSIRSADMPSGGVLRLTAAPNGDLWWGSITARKLTRLQNNALLPTVFSVLQGILSPEAGPGLYQVAFEANGKGWVTGAFDNGIFPVNGDGSLGQRIAVPAGEGGPTGLALGADGNLWYNQNAGYVGRVTPAGTITPFAKQDGSGAGSAIAAGADGNVWYSVDGSNGAPGRIGWVTPSGTTTERTLPGVSAIVSLTAGADGSIWATDATDSSLLRIDTGAPAAVAKAPSVSGSTTVGGTLSCSGETFASWPGDAPTTTVAWTRNGTAIAGATGRAYTTTSADLGAAVACSVTGRYAVQKVWAPATSAAVTVAAAGANPTATPTPAPPTVVLGTGVPKTTLPPATVAKVQLITCKYKKPKGKAAKKAKAKPIKATCKTTLGAAPAASSRDAKGTIGRKGKNNPATVIVGSTALRIVSPRILPKGAFTLTVGKQTWTINVG